MRFLNDMAIVRGSREARDLKPTAAGCGYSNSVVPIHLETGDGNARRCDRFQSATPDGGRKAPGVLV
jgi:hypothetical protein